MGDGPFKQNENKNCPCLWMKQLTWIFAWLEKARTPVSTNLAQESGKKSGQTQSSSRQVGFGHVFPCLVWFGLSLFGLAFRCLVGFGQAFICLVWFGEVFLFRVALARPFPV